MLDDPGPLHREYEFLMPIQNTCPWPEPYETLDNDHTYTPILGKARLKAIIPEKKWFCEKKRFYIHNGPWYHGISKKRRYHQ